MNWFVLVVLVIAAARLTHLLADDYILQRPRDWIITKVADHPRLAYLPTCSWCMSIWVGILATWPAHVWGHVHGPVIWVLPLAFSYTTVMLEGLTGWLVSYPDN